MAKGWPISPFCAGYSVQWLQKGRAFLQSPFFLNGFRKRSSRCQWGECVETKQLRFWVACAIVWWCISQAVAGHDSIQTTAAHPMVDIPVLVVGANKLNSRPRRNQETVRRLGDITSMMKPVRIHIWSELFLDLAGLGVAPRIHARVLTRGRRSNPDQPIRLTRRPV